MRSVAIRLCCYTLVCSLLIGLSGAPAAVGTMGETRTGATHNHIQAIRAPPHGADAVLDSAGQYWEGQEVFLRIGDNGTSGRYRMYEVKGGNKTGDLVETIRLNAGGDGGTIYLNNEDGQYVILAPNNEPVRFEDGLARGTGTIGQAVFYIATQTVRFGFEDTLLPENGETTATIDSNRGVYTIELSAENLTDEELTSIFGGTEFRIEDERELTANFTGIPPARYTINATVTDTGVETGATVTIGDLTEINRGPSVSLQDRVVREHRGDIAKFNITVKGTDHATLRIGDPAFGYLALVNVTDANEDDLITVQMNTYRAGWMNASDAQATDVFSVGDGDKLVNATRVTNQTPGLLDVGSYPILVTRKRSEQRGRFRLDEEAFSGMTQFIAPSTSGIDEADKFENVSAIKAATTERSTVAMGDLLVFRIDAVGMNAFLDTATQLTQSAETPPGLALQIRPVDPPPNRNITIRPDAGAATLYEATDSGQYYLVIDTDATNATPGVTYRAMFSIGTGNKRIETDDDVISASTTFTIEEPYLDFHKRNGEDILVKPLGNQLIFGTTNLAPGTDLTILLRSEGRWSFRKERTTTVRESGGFFTSFDFSDQIAVVTFTARARVDGEQLAQTRGVIVKQFPATTPTESTSETPKRSETPIRRTVVKTPNGSHQSPTPAVTTVVKTRTELVTKTIVRTATTRTPGQPGFGLLLAWLTLIATAIAATRRDRDTWSGDP